KFSDLSKQVTQMGSMMLATSRITHAINKSISINQIMKIKRYGNSYILLVVQDSISEPKGKMVGAYAPNNPENGKIFIRPIRRAGKDGQDVTGRSRTP
ncbi:MAG: hypothetical protein IKR86_01300, partial [Candidatus Methanomethylophilaceae archaeon]|nr:hypothetical protein [Candidatus Methanomethylophilaceae archaeon]